jgi:hypothetical protein
LHIVIESVAAKIHCECGFWVSDFGFRADCSGIAGKTGDRYNGKCRILNNIYQPSTINH